MEWRVPKGLWDHQRIPSPLVCLGTPRAWKTFTPLWLKGRGVKVFRAPEDDGKNERVLYCLSKRLHDYENRYTLIEKSCFSLVWAVQNLRHIILPFQVWIVAKMEPLEYLFENPPWVGDYRDGWFYWPSLISSMWPEKPLKGVHIGLLCWEPYGRRKY